MIATDNTANTNDQAIYTPTSVVYNASTNEASLYFFSVAATDSAGNVVLTSANFSVTIGTTPFAQTAGGGQVTITQINATQVPKVSVLNGETFTVTEGGAPTTFQFVDTSNAANQPVLGNTAIDFNSTTSTIASISTDMVAAINAVFHATYEDPNNLTAATAAHDLSSLAPNGTQAMRLRIGDSYQPISTTALSPAAGAAGTSYADAYPVASSTGAPTFTTASQSYVISNQIETTAYDLQWPGGASDAGNRKMINDYPTDKLLIEGGFMNGVGGSAKTFPPIPTTSPTFTVLTPKATPTTTRSLPSRSRIRAKSSNCSRPIWACSSRSPPQPC